MQKTQFTRHKVREKTKEAMHKKYNESHKQGERCNA